MGKSSARQGNNMSGKYNKNNNSWPGKTFTLIDKAAAAAAAGGVDGGWTQLEAHLQVKYFD